MTKKKIEWARRHQRRHEAFLRGKLIPLEQHVSQRFAREFEAALRARGAAAKAAAEAARNG